MTRYRMAVYAGEQRVPHVEDCAETFATRAAAEREVKRWTAHVAPLNRFRKAQGKPLYRHVVETVDTSKGE